MSLKTDLQDLLTDLEADLVTETALYQVTIDEGWPHFQRISQIEQIRAGLYALIPILEDEDATEG